MTICYFPLRPDNAAASSSPSEVAVKEEDDDSEEIQDGGKTPSKVVMESVCCSSDLDQLLEKKDLKVSYNVPRNIGVEHVSEKTTGMLLPNQEVVVSSHQK